MALAPQMLSFLLQGRTRAMHKYKYWLTNERDSSSGSPATPHKPSNSSAAATDTQQHQEMNQCCQGQHQQQSTSESIDKRHGDASVHGFCECGRLCISDFRITDTDAHSYRHKDQMKVLVDQGKEKRDRYLACCRELCKDFTTIVYTVDVMANRETKMAEKRLVSHLAKK